MAALCILLAAACWCDYRKKKIPNYLIATMVLAGVSWRILEEGPWTAVQFVLQTVLIGGLLYPLFKIGTIGAGDVKLFSVAAGYLPFKKIFGFLFISLLIAAIFSLVKLWQNNNFRERLRYLAEYFEDVIKSGSWKLYLENGKDSPEINLCLSGPAFLSLLLYLGGIY